MLVVETMTDSPLTNPHPVRLHSTRLFCQKKNRQYVKQGNPLAHDYSSTNYYNLQKYIHLIFFKD